MFNIYIWATTSRSTQSTTCSKMTIHIIWLDFQFRYISENGNNKKKHLPNRRGSQPFTVLARSTSTKTLLPSIFLPSACLYAAKMSLHGKKSECSILKLVTRISSRAQTNCPLCVYVCVFVWFWLWFTKFVYFCWRDDFLFGRHFFYNSINSNRLVWAMHSKRFALSFLEFRIFLNT